MSDRRKTSPPSPPGHWLLGQLPQLRADMLGLFTHSAREYGDVVAFRFGPRRSVLISHPHDIEQILVHRNREFKKNWALRQLRGVVGDGLLTNEGEAWLRQRRLIQPAFQRAAIAEYGQTMTELAEQMLAGWCDGEQRDLYSDLTRLTLAIAVKTLMDVDAGDVFEQISAAMDTLAVEFPRRFEKGRPLPLWIPTPANRRFGGAVRSMERVVARIISQRRCEKHGRDDLLSRLIRARDDGDGAGMSDRQLRDEVLTMLLAGHETTANAMIWMWLLIVQHPHVEQALLKEFDEALGARAPSVEDIPRLKLTDAVVRETMRLFPSAYMIGRQALAPFAIGGYEFPAGVNLLMSQWVVHRDERWFDNAQHFDPSRWLDGRTAKLPKFAYFPFGGGARTCVGNTFAMQEIVLLLATMLPRFRIAPIDIEQVRPRPAATLRPDRNVMAFVHRRPARGRQNTSEPASVANQRSG